MRVGLPGSGIREFEDPGYSKTVLWTGRHRCADCMFGAMGADFAEG